jgi:hypothetical protein
LSEPEERLGVVVVELFPDERLGVVVVELFPDERLGVVVVELLPEERLGVVEEDVPAAGFLVPVLDDGLVVTEELPEGVELAALLPDDLVVPDELRTVAFDELRVLLSDGRVELAELLDGVAVGLACAL